MTDCKLNLDFMNSPFTLAIYVFGDPSVSFDRECFYTYYEVESDIIIFFFCKYFFLL